MIAWFARNHVAANLLMAFILFAGVYSIAKLLPLEVFPEFKVDIINIMVTQRAATPEDMETGVVNRIEEAIADLTDVKEISSRAMEQVATVTAVVRENSDPLKLLNEIKNRVDALSTLPQTAERPIIEKPVFTQGVLSVVVSGDIDEKELSEISRRVRDDLVRQPGITRADIEGIRPYEIAIEVKEATLRQYGLTLVDVSSAVSAQSLDLSAGQVRSASGEILLRAKSQAYRFDDYENLTIKRFADGSLLRLGDIAEIHDGFEEDPINTTFNGKPAAVVEVFRVGQESAIAVSRLVHEYLDDNKHLYPPTVTFGIWDDDSEIVKARLSMLLSNAWQGALLVMILLALFLHPKIALWVVIGIPVSFAGGFALMPLLDISINTLSLFAFIIVLGIVVDDAIITGENVYSHYARDPDGLTAAINGTKEIAVPVTFGVLTTLVAFVPLTQMTGMMATAGAQIGWVVIIVMAFSLLESKLILPAHLKSLKPPSATQNNSWMGHLSAAQRKVSASLDVFIAKVYAPLLSFALHRRYLTLLVFCSTLIVSIAVVQMGWIRFTSFPSITSDEAKASIRMPVGTPLAATEQAVRRIEAAAISLQEKYRSPSTGQSKITNIIATTGADRSGTGGASNRGRVRFETELAPIPGVEVSMPQLVREWRELTGKIPGAEELSYSADIGHSSKPVDVQLSSEDTAMLTEVTAKVREHLQQYAGVFDISDTLSDGKRELRITLKPEAELLGLDLQTVTRQVRAAFFGEQSQRIQRGRDDIRVMVRYPLAERISLANLDELLIMGRNGDEARFADIATIDWQRSPSNINHFDRDRTVNITADIDKDSVNQSVLFRDIGLYVDNLLKSYPTVSYSLAGEAKEQRESMDTLLWGSAGVLFAIYVLLAIPFGSYSQPFIVMSVIPFAMVGAIVGHMIMGREISTLSMTGMMALIGVVVNDSLVLVDWINRKLQNGGDLIAVVAQSGADRFRAIMLTSLTTFLGLFPLMFETSTGAQFVIPMSISLGYGILFATFVTLLLVPCNYLILNDLNIWREQFISHLKLRLRGRAPAGTR